ncbi:hypothetical protein ACN38_g6167 [Penicillium nordicum]|uniref:Uncharacterized protein n=1 Tax=Penicillium nordicum TaxID=229535 RepID=A0A0M8P8H9_9EURO|nr:hypothetical protein ACN38_g6167 [Penicillium nordicum]
MIQLRTSSSIFHQRVAMSKKDFGETIPGVMHIGVLLRRSRAPVTNFPLANQAAFYMLFISSHLPLAILQVTMEDSIPLRCGLIFLVTS